MKENSKIHVVYAHPEPQSFVAAMRNVIVEYFEESGHQVTLSDLYAQNFNPVASGADFSERADNDYLVYAMEQRNGQKNGTLAEDIEQELQRVLDADLVVFVFPIFWFDVPAIMKGWIDRVLVSGVCYGGKRIYGEGGLAGKKALTVFATGGRSYMFGPKAIHGELEMGMLRHLHQGTLGYVGMEVLEPFVAYHVPYLTHEQRQVILDDLKQSLGSLNERAVLPMPDLADFGPRFEVLDD